MIYFTSDTHFGSQRTLELSKRPFRNVRDMDSVIVDNWNYIVGNEDIVYHLGDFGNYEMRKYLNGHIILICGNYEYNDTEISTTDITQFGFEEVALSERYLLFNHMFIDYVNKEYVNDLPDVLYLMHEPEKAIKCTHLISDSNIVGGQLNLTLPQNHKEFNLFGHIHKLQMVKRYGLNVGVDCHDFMPIDINTVLFYRNAILNHYDNNVFD